MLNQTRKIRLVQIGFGHIGKRRTCLTQPHPQIDVVGVVDIKRERLNIAREIVGERCVLETDYLRVLQYVRPDAVIISTPNAFHAPMTFDSLAAGAHVLCEKPLATSSIAVKRCAALANRKGLRLKVGSNHRFWRGVREILSGIEQGVIGEVKAINGEVGYLLPDDRSDWYREKKYSGGGTLIDNSPHLIDVFNQILQVSGGDSISRVRCSTERESLGFEVEDQADGELFTRLGRRITLSSTWANGDYRMNLSIQGTRGSFSLTGFNELTIENKDGDSVTKTFDDVPPMESWEMDIQAFVDAILLGGPVRGSAADGLKCVRIIEALYDSSKIGSDDIIL